MKRFLSAFYKQGRRFIIVIIVLIIFALIPWFYDRSLTFTTTTALPYIHVLNQTNNAGNILYRRQTCSCTRPIPQQTSNLLIIDETSSSLCSEYSTLRGSHQRIIAISMYGPKENAIFAVNASLNFLYELISDMKKTYPGWILRVYHDASIKEDVVCPIECAHQHVDFCNASALGNLGSASDYIPPKIWRFLPAGDLLVDIMGSRDLDSPLAQRELDAVNEWLSTSKPWHAMRDHPYHTVPMLGGMWGFRPALNRTFASIFLRKMLDRSLVSKYGGRADQTFLQDHVWPSIQDAVIAHDSFLCTAWYGKNSQPWPSRRPPVNGTDCFVGCVRPCCRPSHNPFGECPVACRPKNHTDWTLC